MNNLSNQELAALIRKGDAEAQTEAIARLIEALPNPLYYRPPVTMLSPCDALTVSKP